MFCRSVILGILNSITETIQVTGGCMLASPSQNHPDRLWGPPTLLLNRCKGVKRSRFDADQLFLANFKIKNKCSCTSTLQYLHGVRTEFIKVSNRLVASFLKAEDPVVWHIYIYICIYICFAESSCLHLQGRNPTKMASHHRILLFTLTASRTSDSSVLITGGKSLWTLRAILQLVTDVSK
jgi:hypothetical protein